MYLWYLAAFVVFLAIELMTYNLITIWLSASALLTAVYAYFFPAQIVAQGFVFLVLSLVFIVFTKPLITKMKIGSEKTNADRLIGCDAIVLEDINSILGSGQVKVMGQIWSAKSQSGDVILSGETVKILGIEGVKLIVS